MQVLLHIFGLDDGSSPWYLWWSGVGSDISELAIIGAILAAFRHKNCHVRGCWRMGAHAIDGTPYVVCRRHHPDVPEGGATLEEIVRAHAKARR